MSGLRSTSTRWLSSCVLALSCATPIREDPPSKLGQTDGDSIGSGGSGSGGSAPISIGTATSQDTSSTGAASSTTGSSTSSSATSSASSNDSTGSDTADSSSSSSTNGSGGSTADTTGNTSTNTTGEVMIPENEVWGDTFESYAADGPASAWTFLETLGDWSVFSEDGNQYYGAQAEASNRNMTYYPGETWSDVRLQVDLRLREGDDSTRIYLAVRAALAGSKLDYYHAYIRGDGRVQLGMYVGGSTTEDTDAHQVDTGTTLDGSTWHTFAVSAVGDVVTAELDGEEIVSGTISGGLGSGFIALGVDSGLVDFDNVSVQTP